MKGDCKLARVFNQQPPPGTFPVFLKDRDTNYLLDIMFTFGTCQPCTATVAPGKCKWDWKKTIYFSTVTTYATGWFNMSDVKRRNTFLRLGYQIVKEYSLTHCVQRVETVKQSGSWSSLGINKCVQRIETAKQWGRWSSIGNRSYHLVSKPSQSTPNTIGILTLVVSHLLSELGGSCQWVMACRMDKHKMG